MYVAGLESVGISMSDMAALVTCSYSEQDGYSCRMFLDPIPSSVYLETLDLGSQRGIGTGVDACYLLLRSWWSLHEP